MRIGNLTATLQDEFLYDIVGGPRSKPVIKTEYYSDTSSTWKEFDDVESRQISISNENKRYQNYSFMPPSKNLSLQLNNFGQVYSTGSGNSKANILEKNLKIRCWSGYQFPSGTTAYFKQGTYIADDPKLKNSKVSISGRDYLRKALETEINMPTFSSIGVDVAITKALDRANIPYDTSTWDSTNTVTSLASNTIAQTLNNQSAWKNIDYLMDVLNAGNDDWRFIFNDDGKPELNIIPTGTEADWSAHYKYNIERVIKSFDSEKQLQTVTCFNKDIIVDPEKLLLNTTGTASSSTLHCNYATAIYVRYEDDTDIIQSEIDRNNTGIDFSVNSGAAYTIRIYGCEPKNAITNEIFQEKGNSENILNKNGSTYKRINPYMNNDSAKAFCDYLISLYSNPAKKVSFSMVANPLLELNDNIIVFDKYTYTDDLYNVTSITENYSNPGLKQTIELKNKGYTLGDFIYDRNGLLEGTNDIQFDKNFVWDQDLEIVGSDDTDYSNTKEISFRSN